MSAENYKSKKRTIAEHRKNWEQLIYTMADGDIKTINEIKAMDAKKEFWLFMDSWNNKRQEKLNQIKQQNKKR